MIPASFFGPHRARIPLRPFSPLESPRVCPGVIFPWNRSLSGGTYRKHTKGISAHPSPKIRQLPVRCMFGLRIVNISLHRQKSCFPYVRAFVGCRFLRLGHGRFFLNFDQANISIQLRHSCVTFYNFDS